MIYRVRKVISSEVTYIQMLKCVDTEHKDPLGNVIGKVIGLTNGKFYANLSSNYNTPKGAVTIRNDNSAIVKLLANRFTTSKPELSYTRSLMIPFSDTEILANIIKLHEGAE